MQHRFRVQKSAASSALVREELLTSFEVAILPLLLHDRSSYCPGRGRSFDRPIKENDMRRMMKQTLVAAAIALGMSGVAVAERAVERCYQGTLEGLYVFSATGYNIVAGVAQPKAITELIRFNADGTLSVPAASRSVNGVTGQSPPGGTGAYAVTDLVPGESACTGSLTFTGGPSFDLFIAPKGEDFWMIQNNPNTVLQGMVTRLSN
jgi:hypothetical protein